MEGDASDKNIAFALQDDAADGPHYHQEWQGTKQTAPISAAMNALRLATRMARSRAEHLAAKARNIGCWQNHGKNDTEL